MFEEDTGSEPGLQCEQEVLRTDTGSGDRILCVGLEPPWWYRRVGWERSQAQIGCGPLNVSFMQLWARARFRARLAPPGKTPLTKSRARCPAFPLVTLCCPKSTYQSGFFLLLHVDPSVQLSTSISSFSVSLALRPWMPLSLAIWSCCCRQSCPVESCRPTFGGCTTSVSTVPISLASTFPGMEVRSGWREWAGI